MADIFTPEKRSEVMRAIKSKWTGIEKVLFVVAKEFWPTYRYRKHFKIHGVRCDLWIPKLKLAIFADGDFWHGRNFVEKEGKYDAYWKEKIANNMARDRRQTEMLESKGIRVLRIWGSDMLKDKDLVRKGIEGVAE